MIREIRDANQVTEKELKKLKQFQLKCKEKKLAEGNSKKSKTDPDEIPTLLLGDQQHIMPPKAYDSANEDDTPRGHVSLLNRDANKDALDDSPP